MLMIKSENTLMAIEHIQKIRKWGDPEVGELKYMLMDNFN